MEESISQTVTQILGEIESGNPAATEQLFPLVYDELRRMAQVQMNGENPGHTLQATALVHEVFLKLAGRQTPIQWESRGHFFTVAADAMRKLLVDHARSRLRIKRGGNVEQVPLADITLANQLTPEQLVTFDDVLEKFSAEDPLRGKLVKLRCFAGLDREALSNVLGISLASVDRYWKYAKVRLYYALTVEQRTDD